MLEQHFYLCTYLPGVFLSQTPKYKIMYADYSYSAELRVASLVNPNI